MKTRIALACLLALSVSSNALAGFMIRLNPGYFPTGSDDGEVSDATKGDKISSTTLTNRADVGWSFNLGELRVPIGGSWLYSKTSSEDDDYDTTPTETTKATNTALGPWIGIDWRGFDIDFIYYLSSSSKSEFNDGTTTTSSELKKGSGWELSFGYLFPIAEAVSIGPRYVVQNFSYEELLKTNGTTDVYSVRKQSFTNSQFLLGIEIELGGGGRRGRF